MNWFFVVKGILVIYWSWKVLIVVILDVFNENIVVVDDVEFFFFWEIFKIEEMINNIEIKEFCYLDISEELELVESEGMIWDLGDEYCLFDVILIFSNDILW